jgi:hypothetical protein
MAPAAMQSKWPATLLLFLASTFHLVHAARERAREMFFRF